MSRKEFGYLLQQYLAGKCTEKEKQFVEHWFGVLQNENQNSFNPADLNELEPIMWDKIKSRTGVSFDTPKRNPSKLYWKWATGIAASLLLAFLFTQNFDRAFPNEHLEAPVSISEANRITEKNTSERPKQIVLPDGSKVVLEPGSRLTYPRVFEPQNRVVLLAGHAFFDIEKDANRPFHVYSGGLTTEVLGTSFRINAKSPGAISVEVVTGKVAVYKTSDLQTHQRNDLPDVILSPNQKVVYFEKSHKLITSLVDTPQMIPVEQINITPPSFVFEETPMGTVLHQITEAYGITIQLENPELAGCPLTADLSELTLYEQLDTICAATKTNYVVSGTSISINGKGCAHLD